MNISCFTDDLLRVRAWTAIFEGRFRSAKKLLQKSLDTFRQSGSKDGIVLTLCELAYLDRLQDRCDTAESSLAEAMELIRQMDSRRYLASGLQESVFLATAQARHERAVERLGKLEALREEIGMPLTPRSRGGWERAIEISRTAWARNHFQRFEKKGAWLRSTGSTAKSRNAQPSWLLQVRNVAIAASSSEPYPVDWTALTSVAFPAASDEMEICPTN